MDLASLREDFVRGALDERSVDPDAIRQFRVWFQDAVECGIPSVNAMALATATADGVPSVRMVLLKGVDPRGFVFYTNYESVKGRELAANPNAALCFYWRELERQIRIQGRVEQTTTAESDAYFATRPEGSRFGAAASPQSSVLPDRAALESKVAGLRVRYPHGDVPRPANWGGYRVVPEVIEFWQGRPDRLHDRIRYTLAEAGWVIERLAP